MIHSLTTIVNDNPMFVYFSPTNLSNAADV